MQSGADHISNNSSAVKVKDSVSLVTRLQTTLLVSLTRRRAERLAGAAAVAMLQVIRARLRVQSDSSAVRLDISSAHA